jgi:hypothetical protein
MDRHEYKRQNEQRDAHRKAKLFYETIANRRLQDGSKWRRFIPAWWNIPSDRFAFFVALFTGVLVLVGYCQLNAISGQLDAMEADQRAWVSLNDNTEIRITAPLTFEPAKGASMSINYVLRNTGRSPALHVMWRSKIIALPMTKRSIVEIPERQNELCEPLRDIAGSFLDIVAFPGDKIPRNEGLFISTEDIEIATKARQSGPLAHDGFISMALIACVDYQSSVFKHHQTRYAFHLGVPMASGMFMGDLMPDGVRPDVRLIYFSQSAD